MEPKIQSYSELNLNLSYQENPKSFLTKNGMVQVWTNIEKASLFKRLIKTIEAVALVIFTAFTALLFQKCRAYCKNALSGTIEKAYYIDWKTLPASEVIKAVRKNGLMLEHASPDLKNNLDVVKEAVSANELAVQYASEDMKKNPEILALLKNQTNPNPAVDANLKIAVPPPPLLPILKYDSIKDINKQLFIQTAKFLSSYLKQFPNKSHIVFGLSRMKDWLIIMTELKDDQESMLQILKSMEIIHKDVTADIFFKEYPQLLNALKDEVIKAEEDMSYICGGADNYSSVCALTEILKGQENIPTTFSYDFEVIKKAIDTKLSFQDILNRIPQQTSLNIAHNFCEVMNWQKKFVYFPNLNKFCCRDGSIVFANFMQLKDKLSVYFGDGYTLVALPFEEKEMSKHSYKSYCLYCADPTKLEETLEKFKSEIGENWAEIQQKSQVLDVLLQMPMLSFSKEWIEFDPRINIDHSFKHKIHFGIDTKGIKLNVNQIEGENILADKKCYRYPIKLDQPFIYFSVATHKTTGNNILLPTLIVNDAEFLFHQKGEQDISEPPIDIPYKKSTLLTSNEIAMELAKDPKNWNFLTKRLEVVPYLENKSPISLTSFEIGNVKFKILNYTESDVSLDKHRHRVVQGRFSLYPNANRELHPSFYTEDDCYVLVFNHNKCKGGIGFLDHDVEDDTKHPLRFFDDKGMQLIQGPLRR